MHIPGHQFALSYGGLHELFTTFKLLVDISCLVPYQLKWEPSAYLRRFDEANTDDSQNKQPSFLSTYKSNSWE